MKLKKYLELRDKARMEMKALLDAAGEEERALTPEEREKFDKLEEEVRGYDDTINAINASRELELNAPSAENDVEEKRDNGEEDVEKREYEAFDAFLRGEETRDDVTMNKNDNGSVIPTSIANKIIQKVVDICPVYKNADRYNVPGTLTIPYYDDETNDIKMTYADEFTDGESSSGSFKNISLTGFLGRAITDISKSLINNSQFDIVNFVVNRMAMSISRFIEKELLIGSPGNPDAVPPVPAKILGLSGVTQTVESYDKDTIKGDNLFDLQDKIPDAYQADACWIMNRTTRNAIRKIKNGQGEYLLNRDMNARWGYTLLGKDVYTSDDMEELGENGKTIIYYGDLKGLAVKVSEDISIDVLHETKARQHVVEVLGFIEMDSKVQNAQMLAKMVTPAV